MPTKRIRQPTEKQKKVIKLLKQNTKVNNSNKTLTKKEIIRLSGYSKSMETQPSIVINSPVIQKAISIHDKKILILMEDEQEQALLQAKKKRGKASYRDLISSASILNKDKRLIRGESTDNKSISKIELSLKALAQPHKEPQSNERTESRQTDEQSQTES